MMTGPKHRACDVCDGEGTEEDEGGHISECHLCDGAGYFDENGDPITDDGED